MSRVYARAALALLVAALSVAAPVRAQQPVRAEGPEEAIRFNYEAPAACPNLVAFAARVRQRTTRGRVAEPGELARTFTLDLRADEGGYVGSVEFLDETGQRVVRSLHGEQCDAVVSGLALITALSLDSSLRAEEPTDAGSYEPEPHAPTDARPKPVVVEAAPQPPPAPAPARKRTLTAARLGISAGFDSATEAPRFGLLGELDWRSGLGLRLTAHYGTSRLVVDRDHRVDLRVLGVEAALCAFRVGLDYGLALVPCANFDVGTLRVAGLASEVVTKPKNQTVLWAAAGAEARLAYEPEAPWWVELRGSLQVPLYASHRFDFEKPTVTGYQVPYYQASGAIALGWRFW